MPMGNHMIPQHRTRIRQKLPLGDIKVAIHKAVHSEAAPNSIAQLDGPAVSPACRIIHGVTQKVVQRDGPVHNLIAS